ncbi:MAG: gamma-glutamylcyclotransferase [Gammaproteobacteria bacterium]|nr:gamma-glutamylcyclotransferase [Gammaproteobacteria bacterium]
MVQDESLSDVFVYGTLIFSKIITAVLGKAFDGETAKLHDFAAYKVIGESYPGLWRLDGVSAEGVLYHGMSKEDLAKLDRYEGEEYQREIMEVETEDGCRHRAWVYMYRPAYIHLLSEIPWSAEHFNESDINEYVARMR